MRKKADLNNLPRKGKLIQWGESINQIVRCEYEGEIYYLKIVGYDKDSQKLKIEYNGEVYNLLTSSLTSCSIGNIVKNKGFIYNVGDCIKDEKRNLTILRQFYITRKFKSKKEGVYYYSDIKNYEVKCNKCNQTTIKDEHSLKSGRGCFICSPYKKIPTLNVNTIWDTDRWMVDLGVSEEDAKSNTHGTHKKIEVTCPDCGRKSVKGINKIYEHRSISCKCGGKTSYPEKFMISVLEQLNVKMEYQLTNKNFDWCDNYRYDFYIPSLNMIIETHGEQHYKECPNFKMTLAETQENDKEKESLALANNIDKYIVIDCRESSLEWIKNSILDSELSTIFDLSNINWLKCDEFALKNLVKEICSHWNNRPNEMTTKEFAEIYGHGLCRATIIRYLKDGDKHGWCNYDPKEEMRKSGARNGKDSGMKVSVFKDNILLQVFTSLTDLDKQSEEVFGVRLERHSISNAIKKNKPYKGFTFKYATETEQNNQKESA